MNRVVWLNAGFVPPETCALSIDDPGVRYGEGLIETMRGADGHVPWLDRHLARLAASIADLRLAPMPEIAAVREAVLAAAARIAGTSRIRVTVTPAPTLLVEAAPVHLRELPVLSAVALRGTWLPERRLAEHKTLSFMGWRDAQRRAHEAGADTALLLDGRGALGEAASANAFCVIDGNLVTSPVRGLLPGIVRGLALELLEVHEAEIDEQGWRSAEEIILTSGVQWVAAVGRIDGRTVGDGEAGPVARRMWELIRDAAARDRRARAG